MPDSVAFFVHGNNVERLTAPVAIFARAAGIPLHDRSSTANFDPDNCGIDWSSYRAVLAYGSVQFLRQLKASSLARFVLHDDARFATQAWALLFGDEALNGAGRVLKARDVASVLASEGPAHLRPDSVDKAFTGALLDRAGWEKVREERNLSDDLDCWMSPCQAIDAEWRCWFVGGRLIEISKYRESGVRALAREAAPQLWQAAQRFAACYLPASSVVLDIARVGGTYKVIEFNPIHSSGWYAANVDLVLGAWVEWANAEAGLAI